MRFAPQESHILRPVNVVNVTGELLRWVKYRAALLLQSFNHLDVRAWEEERLRKRVQVWSDIRLVADDAGGYEQILQALKSNDAPKRLVIGGGVMYGLVSFLIARDMIESGVDFTSFVGSSMGSIVASLLAIDELDKDNISYFLEWLPEKIEPTELGEILIVKLLPFFADIQEDGEVLTIPQKKEISRELVKKSAFLRSFSEGMVDVKSIEHAIGAILQRKVEINKWSFVDVRDRFGKRLSVNATGPIRRRRGYSGRKDLLPGPELLELQGGYPIIDAILCSCGASGVFSKRQLKQLKIPMLDAMWSGWQYSNAFPEYQGAHTNVLIHTEWFFGIMRLLLPGYGENNYVVAPRLFGTDCFDRSEASVNQLIGIASRMVGKDL